MKIAMVFDGIGFGGIERVGLDYIKLLSERGHDVTVYNLIPSANDLEKEIESSVKIKHCKLARKMCPDFYTSLVKRWKYGKYVYMPVYMGLSVLNFFYRLLKGEKKEKYDVAIAFSGHFNDLTFVDKNYVKAKKKVCWLHGGLLDYALISDGYLLLYNRIKNLVTLSSFYQDGVLSVNRFLKDLNIRKIYNPTYVGERKVDSSYVAELKEKYGDFILMVGRITKEKDHRTVIRAAKVLKEKYHVHNKIVFVGDGAERDAVQQYANEMGMKEQIVFEGSRYDVQNYYAAARILVHSSPAEGLPTVLLEAMSFGVPIVATNSLPGVAEILEGSKDGMVCEVGDENVMAEHIHKLLNDEELRENYIKLGERRIQDFKPDCIAGQLEEYLECILK